MKQLITLVLVIIMLSVSTAYSWDGTDQDTYGSIEIGGGNLVRDGESIEFYDGDSGEYRYGTVESIDRYGSTVEVQVYDETSGETRTFDMED